MFPLPHIIHAQEANERPRLPRPSADHQSRACGLSEGQEGWALELGGEPGNKGPLPPWSREEALRVRALEKLRWGCIPVGVLESHEGQMEVWLPSHISCP